MRSAYDIPFSPGDPTMWEQDPRTVWHALEEMATRQASDVDGPASSTDNALVRWDGTTGKLLQNSLVTIDDSGSIQMVQGQRLLLDTDGDTHLSAVTDDIISLTAGGVGVFAASATELNFGSTIQVGMTEGKKLTLDADADTSIRASADDVMAFATGGSDRIWITNTAVSLFVPLDLSFSEIQFGSGTDISGGGANIRMAIAGVEKINVQATLIQITDPLHVGTSVTFTAGNTTRITGGATLMTLHVGAFDLITLTDTDITMEANAQTWHDGTDVTISVPAASSADGGDLTFDCSDADGNNNDGGSFIIIPGAEGGLSGVDGRFVVRNVANAADVFAVGDDVGIVLGATLNANNNTISAVVNMFVNDDGSMGIDANTRMQFLDAESIQWTANSVQGLTLTDLLLDGKGVLRLTGFAGQRMHLPFGWPSANTATSRVCYTAGQAIHGAARGYTMTRAGSIISVTMNVDINAAVSADCVAQVYKNTSIFTDCKATLVGPGVGDGQIAKATFAVGTHTFAADDIIGMRRDRVGTSLQTDDMAFLIEVEFDS